MRDKWFSLLGLGIIFLGTALQEQAIAEDDLLSILAGPRAQDGAAAQPGDAAAAQPGDAAAAQLRRTPLRGLLSVLNAEQNIFFGFLEAKEWDKALYQWGSAFADSSFAKTPNGQAFYAWLIAKNGLTLLGLERLLSIASPETIAKDLESEWKSVVPSNHEVWSNVRPSLWQNIWTQWYGSAVEVRVRGRDLIIGEKSEEIKDLLSKAQPNSPEYAWLVWQLTIGFSAKDPGRSAQSLAHLMKVKNGPVGDDLMNLTAARVLYQNGFLDAAIKYYEKIQKNSDYWLDAQEEIGWSYLRKGQPQNTVAVTQTLASKHFVKMAGPEALFLRSLAQLKICDYTSVAQSLNQFREVFKPRALAMIKLSHGEAKETVRKLSERMQLGSIKTADLGRDWEELPRMVTRDHLLKQQASYEARLKAESAIAGQLYAQSLSGGSATIGFQGDLEKFRLSIDQVYSQAKGEFDGRIKQLAEEEAAEIQRILLKMQIVEAEVLQQSSLADRIVKTGKGKEDEKIGSTGAKGQDLLVFKTDSELWFDELSNYKVDVKGACQASKKR